MEQTMDISKKLNFGNIFIFLFLILFPFGQIIRIGVLQPLDIVVGLAAAYTIIKRLPKPDIFKYFLNFLFIAGFSWLLGALIFWRFEAFYGLLYLIRLASYFYFLIYVWDFVKKSSENRKLLLNSLVIVSAASAVFGWMQYFAFPNIKPFTVWGWDDHLFRLVGTFLDPTFLGMILVFGALTSLFLFIQVKKKIFLLAFVFLLVSLAFTYSRASYLAFLTGIVALGFYKKKMKQILYAILALILLILILPTSGNTILRITREFSAIARLDNYSDTVRIFFTSPVFGVGYNNLCLAKGTIGQVANYQSHACSGSDSSLLFILATTGTIGLIVFIYSIWIIAKSVSKSSYLPVLVSAFLALLVHSLFSNSLVYSWIIGYLIILTAVCLRREV